MKMKLHIIIYIAALLPVGSCSDSWDDRYTDVAFVGVSGNTLSVSTNTLEFSNNGGQQDIYVSSTGLWTAKTSASWVTLSATLGGHGNNTVAVSVPAYSSTTEDRSAVITITDGVSSTTINVQQTHRAEILQADVTPRTYSFEGGSSLIGVMSNVDWSVSSDMAWLGVKKNSEGNAIVVNIEPNLTDGTRKATITVRGVSLQQSISIAQTGIQFPTVKVNRLSDIGMHSVDCQIYAYSRDLDITQFGVCYSTQTGTPDCNNSETVTYNGGGKDFTHTFRLTGLKSNATHYVRPYVVTQLGIQYGDAVKFNTLVAAPSEDDNGTPND